GLLADSSIQETGGVVFYGVWAAIVAWPLWLLISGGMSWPARQVGLVVALLLAFGLCDVISTTGSDGDINFDIVWRWAPTANDQNLAEREKRERAEVGEGVPLPTTDGPGDWPGFRGKERDGVAREATVGRTNWSEEPPKLLWKYHVGPGWSSFAVVGGRIYTQ